MHEQVIAQIVINDLKRVSQKGDNIHVKQYCTKQFEG